MKTIKTNKKLTWCRISQQCDFPVSDLKKKNIHLQQHLEATLKKKSGS